jgi:hypothetical protein
VKHDGARLFLHVQCNTPPAGWRERLATVLRQAAGRLDGRVTLAVRIRCAPPPPAAVHAAALVKGLEHAGRCLESELRAELHEQLLREALPSLWPAGGSAGQADRK